MTQARLINWKDLPLISKFTNGEWTKDDITRTPNLFGIVVDDDFKPHQPSQNISGFMLYKLENDRVIPNSLSSHIVIQALYGQESSIDMLVKYLMGRRKTRTIFAKLDEHQQNVYMIARVLSKNGFSTRSEGNEIIGEYPPTPEEEKTSSFRDFMRSKNAI